MERLFSYVAPLEKKHAAVARNGTRMVIEHRSSEEWLVAVNEIIRRFRQNPGGRRPEEQISFDDALALMRQLGFTTGEAIRLLRNQGQR